MCNIRYIKEIFFLTGQDLLDLGHFYVNRRIDPAFLIIYKQKAIKEIGKWLN